MASPNSVKESRVSHHIHGNHPVRACEPEDREEVPWLVFIPMGFEPMIIAVWGDGLHQSDAVESAFEHLRTVSPDLEATEEDWQLREENAFARKQRLESDEPEADDEVVVVTVNFAVRAKDREALYDTLSNLRDDGQSPILQWRSGIVNGEVVRDRVLLATEAAEFFECAVGSFVASAPRAEFARVLKTTDSEGSFDVVIMPNGEFGVKWDGCFYGPSEDITKVVTGDMLVAAQSSIAAMKKDLSLGVRCTVHDFDDGLGPRFLPVEVESIAADADLPTAPTVKGVGQIKP